MIYISGQKNKILVIVDNKELEKIIFIAFFPMDFIKYSQQKSQNTF